MLEKYSGVLRTDTQRMPCVRPRGGRGGSNELGLLGLSVRDELLDADDVAVLVQEEDHRLALLETELVGCEEPGPRRVERDRRLVVEGHDRLALRERVLDEVLRVLESLLDGLVTEERGVGRELLEHLPERQPLRLPVGVEVRVAAGLVGRLLDAGVELEPLVGVDLLRPRHQEGGQERTGERRAGEHRVAEACGEHESELGVLHPDVRAQLDAFAGERARLIRSVLDRVGVAPTHNAANCSFRNQDVHLSFSLPF